MPSSLHDPAVEKALLDGVPPITASPADWRDHWIYFLLVDRYNNPAVPPRLSDPTIKYQGGTLKGIQDKIPYLKKLGVGAIWLSPVISNTPWCDFWGGYCSLDLLRIEPRFCSDPQRAANDPSFADEEFRDLVDEAHRNGIYVILDIVLNHMGDLFNYEGMRDAADWNPNGEYGIYWRNSDGAAQGAWTDIATVPSLPPEAGVWPKELQRNDYFRRRGSCDKSPDMTWGDFYTLKELVTEYKVPGEDLFPVRDILIRAYQYLIAKFDIDGFRIDTLQYVEPDFARIFGNSIREFALSIGKKNFLTYGEIWVDDNEYKIAQFIGRNTVTEGDIIGVDAAIDFPMRKRLWNACKCQSPPSDLAEHFDERRRALKTIVSSHGDAGQYFVTFLENHDLNERFHYKPFAGQTGLALTCLLTMQGIPCIYYGMENGLDGRGDCREYVREAFWGKGGAFSESHDLYRLIRALGQLRQVHPALRYGRQYFRKLSGNGFDFGYSTFSGGIIAYSRILNDRELLIVANTNANSRSSVYVNVDKYLNPTGRNWDLLFSTTNTPSVPSATTGCGPYQAVKVSLAPMEAQVLG